jgi:hypothetical protein
MLITGVGRGSSSNKIIGSTVMNAPNGTAKYRVLLNKSVVEDPEVDVDNGCQNCGPGGRGSSGGTGQAPGH